MKICKNDLCENVINDNRIYCSQSCRTIYTNKHMKDYKHNTITINKKIQNKKDEYYENPNLCKQCSNIIPYEKRRNVFCGRSCSGTYTNLNREVHTHVLSEEGRKSLLKAVQELKRKYMDVYDENYKMCPICNEKIPYNKRKYKFCSYKCERKYRKNLCNTNEYIYYKNLCKFKFNVFKYPDEFDLSLIDKFGMYKAKNNGNNLTGISRDHRISINDGFRYGILPYYISHPANCQLMIHSDNNAKNTSSDISLNELMENIKIWENKYGPLM